MADVIALVSRAVFEREARIGSRVHGLGHLWSARRFPSTSPVLQSLAEGGDLYLATKRPEGLWLVAVLKKLKFDGTQWVASGSNMKTIRPLPSEMDVTRPRLLTAGEVARLGGGAQRPRAPKPPKEMTPRYVVDRTEERALLERWVLTRSSLLADTLQRMVSDQWLEHVKRVARFDTERAAPALRELLTVDDPRLTRFLLDCLLAARWPGSGARALWTEILGRLVTLRDARALEPLRSAAKSPPHFLGIAHTKWMVAQLESAATALAAACEKLPADDETTKALAARQTRLRPLDKPKPVGDSQKLLEAVWAKPDDDAVRLVVADALLERNDPWGEFITLQFRIAAGKASAVDRKRAASLLRVNAQRFGGPIAHIATKNYWAFEKGFLVSCAADRSMVPSRRWKEAASAPHWATVRSVRLSTHAAQSWVTAWAANPALTSLRKVTFRSLELGRESATSPWRLTKANKKLEFAEVKYFRAFVAGLAPPARPKTSHPQLLE